MAARGRVPPAYEGRIDQTPGMMRHGPIPVHGPVLHQPMESLPPPELLGKKVAIQAADMERLVLENQRLAASHVSLRQDLLVTQQELQRLQAHIGGVEREAEIQIRGLMEKIAKMDAEIRSAEVLKKELQQAHLEAQGLVSARKELTSEIQQATEEIQKINADSNTKKLPELHGELDSLRQEHQKLRAAFEYEKSANVQLVEKMRAMERNLLSTAREVEKLRAEVVNAEKLVQSASPYAVHMDPTYPSATTQGPQGSVHSGTISNQTGGYAVRGYNYSGAYAAAGTSGYIDGYGRPTVPVGGATTGGVNVYGTGGDAYGRPPGSVGGGQVAAPEGIGAYGSGANGYVDAYGRVVYSTAPGETMAGASSAASFDTSKTAHASVQR